VKSLRGKLDALAPRPLTELEHRRARTRLLGAAAERARPQPRVVFLTAFAFALAGIVFFVHSHHEPKKLALVVAESMPAPKAPVPASTLVTPPPAPTTEQEEAPPPQPVVHTAKPKTSVAGTSFERAFSNFEKGEYGTADRDFEAFLHEFPSDPRAEDASYLRTVARYRVGDREGAAALARSYLDTYPSGLRRPEAERIAESK
jgi:TolA-binding protein